MISTQRAAPRQLDSGVELVRLSYSCLQAEGARVGRDDDPLGRRRGPGRAVLHDNTGADKLAGDGAIGRRAGGRRHAGEQ